MLYRCKSDRYRASTDNGVVDAYIIGKDPLPQQILDRYDCVSVTRENHVPYLNIRHPASGYTYTVIEGDVIWLHEGHMCVCDGERFHQEFHPIVKVGKRKRTPADTKQHG